MLLLLVFTLHYPFLLITHLVPIIITLVNNEKVNINLKYKKGWQLIYRLTLTLIILYGIFPYRLIIFDLVNCPKLPQVYLNQK